MSEYRLRHAGLCALVLGLALPVHGQDLATRVTTLRRLSALADRAERTADALDTALAAAVRVDTVRFNTITVFVSPRDVAVVTEGTRLLDAELDRLAGGDAPRLFGSFRAFVRLGTSTERDPLLGNTVAVRLLANAAPDEVARRLRDRVSQQITRGAGRAIADWGSTRMGLPAPPSFPRIYRQLLTATSIASRRCFLGDLAWCARALSLVPVEDAVTQWYDAGQRRLLVEREHIRSPLFQRELAAAHKACLEEQLDAACMQLWRAVPPAAIPKPLGQEIRASLVHVALELGGTRAFGRWVGDSARAQTDMGEHLSVTAGVPLDTLLSRWRDRVLQHRPEPTTVPARTQWSAIGWVLLLGVVSIRGRKWLSI